MTRAGSRKASFAARPDAKADKDFRRQSSCCVAMIRQLVGIAACESKLLSGWISSGVASLLGYCCRNQSMEFESCLASFLYVQPYRSSYSQIKHGLHICTSTTRSYEDDLASITLA